MADLYDDSGSDSPSESREKREEGAATSLLPKSFFPSDKDLEVGSTCKVRVEKIMDDQVLVSYAKSEEKTDDDDTEEVVETSDVEMMME